MGGCCCKQQEADDAECKIVVHPVGSKFSLGGSFTTPVKSSGSASVSQQALVSESAVKVAVVVRPLLTFELEKGATSKVQLLSPNKVSLPARANITGVNDGAYEFQFDRVYHAASSAASQALYQEMVLQVLNKYYKGFNATVLAYGQTGSGKTYTMGTAAASADFSSRADRTAVIPQACRSLMEYVTAAKSKYEVTLKASFVEIYNEAIQDLLSAHPMPTSTSSTNLAAMRVLNTGSNTAAPSTPRSVSSEGGVSCSAFNSSASDGGTGISIRETGKGEIVLEGVSERVISNLQDIVQVLEQGNALRATASHKLNQSSSRSHAILSITLEQRAWPSAAKHLPAESRYLRSKLHLVDLAGSERAKETGTTGQRFAEGVSINKGLLELGNVINALTEGTARKHIPYRNSKLTRLLQDSLGGNSETLFIACVSPADLNRDHTISTLRYASRAMAIKNSLKLNNQMSPEEEIAYLRQMVAELQEENDQLKKLMMTSGSSAAATVTATGKAVRHIGCS